MAEEYLAFPTNGSCTFIEKIKLDLAMVLST